MTGYSIKEPLMRYSPAVPRLALAAIPELRRPLRRPDDISEQHGRKRAASNGLNVLLRSSGSLLAGELLLDRGELILQIQDARDIRDRVRAGGKLQRRDPGGVAGDGVPSTAFCAPCIGRPATARR